MSRMQSRPQDNNIFSQDPVAAPVIKKNGSNSSQISFGASDDFVNTRPHNNNKSSISFGDQAAVEQVKSRAIVQQQQLHNQNVDMQNLSGLMCHDGKGGVGSGRVSTKVHAPPGGKSSFSIGGYGGEAEAPQANARFAGKGNASQISFSAQDDAPQANARYNGKGNSSQISFAAQDDAPQQASARYNGKGNSSQISFGGQPDEVQQSSRYSAKGNASSFSLSHDQPRHDYSHLSALACHDGKGGVSSGKLSTKVAAPPGGHSQITF